MALLGHPSPGDLLMCEFGPHPNDVRHPGVMTGPLPTPPEIHKYRPIVIFAVPQHNAAIVVPFSSQQPYQVRKYHHLIPAGTYTSLPLECWVLGHMIQFVAMSRLDRCRIHGQYIAVERLSAAHLLAVRACVKDALGIRP